MRKRCIAIWALTTITFISVIHLIEAITVIMLNNPIRLLQLYPLINEPLKAIAPSMYFYISALTTAIFWGITCLVAFYNPVELYLHQSKLTETQLRDKGELLNRMCETLESDHQTLTHLTDIIHEMQKGTTASNPPKETHNLKIKPLPPNNASTKPAAQPAKATTKPQRTQPLRKKQKEIRKRDENKKPKIETHGATMTLQKIK